MAHTRSRHLSIPLLASLLAALLHASCQVAEEAQTWDNPLDPSSPSYNPPPLEALAVEPGALTPAFSPRGVSYEVSVPHRTTTVRIAATPSIPLQSILYGGGASDAVEFTAPDTETISVFTTNSMGNHWSYSIRVHRSPPVRADSSLAMLSTTPGSLVPAFHPDTTHYLDSVPFGTTSVTIAAKARTPGEVSSIAFNGLASSTIPLSTTSPTPVDVVVTNTNGNPRTYSVRIVSRSADTRLASLTTSAGTLSPGFDPETTEYVNKVPYGTSTTTIAAVAKAPTQVSSLTIDGQEAKQLAVAIGASATPRIAVTGRDGGVRTYTIRIEPSPPDLHLSALSSTPGTLSPAFSPETTRYSDTLPYAESWFSVDATPRTASHTAGIRYNGGTSNLFVLPASGAASIELVLTAPSGETFSYGIDVSRRPRRLFGIPLNPSITYGSLLDARDGRSYRTVSIGDRTWMAENLDYAGVYPKLGTCPGTTLLTEAQRADSCEKYGRLYDSAEIVDGSVPIPGEGALFRGICPESWHIPTRGDWTALRMIAEAFSQTGPGNAGMALKSTQGWESNSSRGLDLLGFRALPAGQNVTTSSGRGVIGRSTFGSWWSIPANDSMVLGDMSVASYDPDLFPFYLRTEGTGFALRCVRDP